VQEPVGVGIESSAVATVPLELSPVFGKVAEEKSAVVEVAIAKVEVPVDPYLTTNL
jgi:hypothetical protein